LNLYFYVYIRTDRANSFLFLSLLSYIHIKIDYIVKPTTVAGKCFLLIIICYLNSEHAIDTELVSNIIVKLKHGKAKDINYLTAEHLYYSHPSLCVALAKLFQLILLCSHVPDGFRHSYIVPVPKPTELHSRSLECNDFRGIAISSIISNVFEHCLLDRFSSFLNRLIINLAARKELDVTLPFVLYAASLIVQGGSNVCALDMSKAFDKVNHYALYLKLMKRKIPNGLLNLLVSWFSECYSCVKWDAVLSDNV